MGVKDLQDLKKISMLRSQIESKKIEEIMDADFPTVKSGDKVMDALKLWKKEKTPIEETLDETLVSRLNGFSRSESGYYTIRIEGGAKQPFRRLIFSGKGMDVSGPSDGVLRYMEWMFL